MSNALNLFDDVSRLAEGIGTIKLVSVDLNGGLFAHDFAADDLMFAHLERVLKVEDFAEDRLQAQQSLLAQNPDFPWNFELDRVYQGLRASEAVELALLRNTWAVRPHVKAVLDWALQNAVPAVAACDSPFSRTVWQEILALHDIVTIDRIYTTVDDKVSKQKYTMFRKILSDYQVEPGQVLHIGANSYNDLGVPRDIGMHALLVAPEREGLAARNQAFGKVLEALGEAPTVDSALLLKAMERAIFELRDNHASSEEADLAAAGIAIAGPLIVGFCNWIGDWVRYHGAKRLFLAAPEKSAFARIGGILLKRQLPDMDIVLAPPERAAELGIHLRDIDVSTAAIVSVDPEGAGVGRLVARNPHLSLRPALHFSLAGSARNSGRDYCYMHFNGIPSHRFQVARNATGFTHLVFDGPQHASQILIAAVSRFVIEWVRLVTRYPGLTIPRSTVLKTLEAAGSLELNMP